MSLLLLLLLLLLCKCARVFRSTNGRYSPPQRHFAQVVPRTLSCRKSQIFLHIRRSG